MNQNLTGRWVFFRTLRIIIFKKRSYLAKIHQTKQVRIAFVMLEIKYRTINKTHM